MGTYVEEPTTTNIPPWIREMQFCHVIENEEMDQVFCGAEDLGGICNGLYDAQYPLAICDVCGRPTCPRCAQLVDIKFRMET